MSEAVAASKPAPSGGDGSQMLASHPASSSTEPHAMGLMGVLATVAMLFAAFTAALLVRRTGTDWMPISLPRHVFGNTFVLVVSSVALERARALVRSDMAHGARRWLAISGSLGVLFLAGQVVAFRILADRGVFLTTNPHAAFFFMLAIVHAAHVIGGLGALTWTFRRMGAGAYTATRHAGLTHTTIYWHFVGVVWIYLVILLSTL